MLWKYNRITLLVVCAFLLVTRTRAATSTNGLSIRNLPATADWPRPCLQIPQLPAAPQIDGMMDEKIWDAAAIGTLTFPLGSNKAAPKDTEFRAGHFGGVLYLLVKYDWSGDKLPAAKGRNHDDPLWEDDGGEICFAPVHDLNHPRKLLFNLNGVSGDEFGVRADANSLHIRFDASWNPHWSLVCRRTETNYLAEMAILLSEVVNSKGNEGDVFRFTLLRNRTGHASPVMHWAPVDGRLNCRPEYFGFAVLTGPEPAKFDGKKLRAEDRSALFFDDPNQTREAISDYPLSIRVCNSIFGLLPATPLTAVLKDLTGRIVVSHEMTTRQWPQDFTIDPASLPDGLYRFELSAPGDSSPLYTTPLEWKPSIRVRAADGIACRTTGRAFAYPYPRSVGETALFLTSKNATVTVTNYGTAVYVCLPPAFLSPGVNLGATAGAKLRCRVDDRPWQAVAILTARREVPLAENLPPGRHAVTVELIEGTWCVIGGFRFAARPLAEVFGHVTCDDFSELLTDVRADLLSGDKLVRSEYLRNPVNSTFEIVDLAPGSYRLRLTASGWLPYESKTFTIARAGEKVDLGVICLHFDPAVGGYVGGESIGYGKTVSVSSGETFSVRIWLGVPIKAAQLVSRYKTIDLKTVATRPLESGGSNVGSLTLELPAGTPQDMYALKLDYNKWSFVLPQAVCVREPLPESFHIAAVGHMNTWGQKTSEYLRQVAEAAQLAGARVLLIANEVNPAYIAGALKDLRIPYLITSGNHTMGRWKDFFGDLSVACDDGPLRVVTFQNPPYESWAEVKQLFAVRPEATCRVLLGFEAWPPSDLIREQKINLLFDGHSDEAARRREILPAGVQHLGLADDQQELRWIPMMRHGPAGKSPQEVPAILFPRGGAAPLRVEFSAPNDGTTNSLTARVVNQCDVAFPHLQIRFVMVAAQYSISGGRVRQQFNSDDGKISIIDAEAEIGAKSTAEISCTTGITQPGPSNQRKQ